MFQTITLSFLAKFIDGPQKTSRQFSNHSKVERMIIRHGHLDAMYLFVLKCLAVKKQSNEMDTNQTDTDQPNTHGSKITLLRVAEHAGNPSLVTILRTSELLTHFLHDSYLIHEPASHSG